MEQATTPSLEALQAYDLGVRDKGSDQDTDSLFQASHRIGPEFRTGLRSPWLRSTATWNKLPLVGGVHRGRHTLCEERVTERERLRIEASLLPARDGTTREGGRGQRGIYEYLPARQSLPHNSLAAIHLWLGQYVKSAEESRECLRIDPGNGAGYRNLLESYFALGQLREAENLLAEADTRLPSGLSADSHYLLGFLRQDSQAMEQAAKSAVDPETERRVLGDQSDACRDTTVS